VGNFAHKARLDDGMRRPWQRGRRCIMAGLVCDAEDESCRDGVLSMAHGRGQISDAHSHGHAALVASQARLLYLHLTTSPFGANASQLGCIRHPLFRLKLQASRCWVQHQRLQQALARHCWRVARPMGFAFQRALRRHGFRNA
jgi:hypothetical protein